MASRRSKRQGRETPEDTASNFVRKCCDQEDKFVVKQVDKKGRGVFSKTTFLKGEFLVEYAGALLPAETGNALEEEGSSGYRYFFYFRGRQYCIDATQEQASGRYLGRLVNHGERNEINAKMKTIAVDGKPALCLFALKDIMVDEEILYDYGVKDLPWKTSKEPEDITQIIAVEAKEMTSGDSKNITLLEMSKVATNAPPPLSDKEMQDAIITDNYHQAFPEEMDETTEDSHEMVAPDLLNQVSMGTLPEISKGIFSNYSSVSCSEDEEGERTDGNPLVLSEEKEIMDVTAEDSQETVPPDLANQAAMSTLLEMSKGTDSINSSLSCSEEEEGERTDRNLKVLSEEKEIMDVTTEDSQETVPPDLANLAALSTLLEMSKGTYSINSSLSCSDEEEGERTDRNLKVLSEEKEIMDVTTEDSQETVPPDLANLAAMSTLLEMSKGTDSINSSLSCSEEEEGERTDRKPQILPEEIVQNSDTESDKLHEDQKKTSPKAASKISMLRVLEISKGSHILKAPSITSLENQQEAVIHVQDCSGEENLVTVGDTTFKDAAPEDGPSSDSDTDDESDSIYHPDNESSCSDSDSSQVLPITKSQQLKPATKFTKHSTDDQPKAKIDVPKPVPEKNDPYKKPYRLCPFCDTLKSKLSQHIAKQHSNIKEVAKALKLPTKERNTAFAAFKKDGILQVNKKQAKLVNPSYQMERSTTKGALMMCNICTGFYSKTYIKRHINRCKEESEGLCTSVSVPVNLLECDEDYAGDFVREILSKFRQDAIGKLCTSDPVLVKIGRRFWYKQKRKADKVVEVRRSVMTDMRRLSSLYLELTKAEETLGKLPTKEGNVGDIFNRNNFNHLEEAVDAYTSIQTESGGVKAGLKLGLYYLLKAASKILKATYFIDDQDERAADVDKFVAILELNYNYMFGDASYKINKQRQVKLRKPDAVPLETDIRCLRDYTIEQMNKLTNMDSLEFMDAQRYTTLRDLVVCRLTLFNARRGGEPSRLMLEEWSEAENGTWVDKSKVDSLDAIDRALIDSLKITYQTGKGNNHLVPVLFPQDTIEPIRKLCDQENRSLASVSENNVFLFPSTNQSDSHVSGWHAVNNVCCKLDLTNKSTVTATKNRHRVSTLFAMMEIPESDRQFVYKHMGHSEETNMNIYQTPLALKELTVVGKRLQEIDNGNVPTSSSSGSTDQGNETSSVESGACGRTAVDAEASSQWDSTDTVSFAECDSSTSSQCHVTPFQGDAASSSKHIGRKYSRWSDEETKKVLEYFDDYLQGKAEKKLPGRKDVLAFKDQSGMKHDWKTIHSKVMNEVRKVKERSKKRQREWE